MRSIILSLWVSPAGKSAVYAPDPLTIKALPFWCFHENNSGLVAIEAPYPLTVTACRIFVNLITRCFDKYPPAITIYSDEYLKTRIIHPPHQGTR